MASSFHTQNPLLRNPNWLIRLFVWLVLIMAGGAGAVCMAFIWLFL